MPLVFDDTRFPRVEVRWSGALTDAELEHFIERMNACFARAAHFTLLIDSQGASVPTSAQRQRLLAHIKETSKSAEAHLIQAIAFESALVRAFYYGITWAIALQFPSRAFSDNAAARAWLERTLLQRTPPVMRP